MNSDGARLVRAAYTGETITVYQAYTPEIAGPAVRDGTFTSGFSRDRMTWIKPSFGWMMYRSGWGRKPGQERVLAIEITRGGWEWALDRSCLSHYAPGAYGSQEVWAAAKTSSATSPRSPGGWRNSLGRVRLTRPRARPRPNGYTRSPRRWPGGSAQTPPRNLEARHDHVT